MRVFWVCSTIFLHFSTTTISLVAIWIIPNESIVFISKYEESRRATNSIKLSVAFLLTTYEIENKLIIWLTSVNKKTNVNFLIKVPLF